MYNKIMEIIIKEIVGYMIAIILIVSLFYLFGELIYKK